MQTKFRIPLMKNAFIDEPRVRDRLSEFVIETDRFSMGSQCQAFEKEFANKFDKKHAVLINSGSSANLAMLQILLNSGLLKLGDKIAFSAVTWSTNVMPIIQLGFLPVPVDVDKETLNVMSWNLESVINEHPDLKGFFSTNVLGLAGDLPELNQICQKHGLIYIEDNCEALGSKVGGVYTGDFGLMSSHSFFIAHHMSTIEGGMLVTNDDELAIRAKRIRSNGWDRNLSPDELTHPLVRKSTSELDKFYSLYQFNELGYNFRPTEISGFLGLMQLEYIEWNVRVRQSNFKRLSAVAKNNPNILPLTFSHMDFVSSFAFPIVLKSSRRLKSTIGLLIELGIECRPLIAGNIMRQPFMEAQIQSNLPNADHIHGCGLYIANHPELEDEEISYLEKAIEQI